MGRRPQAMLARCPHQNALLPSALHDLSGGLPDYVEVNDVGGNTAGIEVVGGDGSDPPSQPAGGCMVRLDTARHIMQRYYPGGCNHAGLMHIAPKHRPDAEC